jgi:hypothetical protein
VVGGGGGLTVSGMSRNRGGFVKCVAIQKRLGIPGLMYQCCAVFLHSRHTKYSRRDMAAHQPHIAYCGEGEMVYGID